MFFMSPEARRQMAPYLDENFAVKQLRRLAMLPRSLKEIGRGLIGIRKPNERYDSDEPRKRERRALKALGGLSTSNRRQLFAALFPSIAEEAEAGWQLFDHLPYQLGFNRRPFRLKRAADAEGASIARRCAWVQQLIRAVAGFDQPVTWFAEWAAFLGWGRTDTLGYLFAGVIDRGGPAGQEIFDILTASARGEHPVGAMGRHVSRALLCASRPDGWEFMEHMLLAAQREEGLRQVIMEAVDEAHPGAFRRMLDVIIKENLVRFSATVRAAGVWFGLPFEAANPREVLAVLAQLRRFLDDLEARQAALDAGKPQDIYLALCSIALEDTISAISTAAPYLRRPQVEHRFAAAFFLSRVNIQESVRVVLPALADEDLRVAACAFSSIHVQDFEDHLFQVDDLFERLAAFVQRLPEKEKILPAIAWDWMTITIDRKQATAVLPAVLGDRPAERLIPYLASMSPSGKTHAAKLLVQKLDGHPQHRAALLALIADRDRYVQEKVGKLLAGFKPRPEEIPALEGLLTRKTDSTRRIVMELLLNLPDAAALASVDRLLELRSEQQRLAGLEMLRSMAQADRSAKACRERIARLRTEALSEAERHVLSDVIDQSVQSYTLEDALGLVNMHNLSRPSKPRAMNSMFGLVKKVQLGSKAAAACIQALDALIEQHRTDPVQSIDWRNEGCTELLGNVHHGLARPDPALALQENLSRFPLAETWETWLKARPAAHCDDDGFELLRAQAALTLIQPRLTRFGEWTNAVPKTLRTYLDEPYELDLKYKPQIESILEWLVYLHPMPGAADFLLDALEELCSRIDRNPVLKVAIYSAGSFTSELNSRLGYLDVARDNRRLHPETWQAEQHARLWGLAHWLEPIARRHGGAHVVSLEDLLLAHKSGAASEDDLVRFLLEEPIQNSHHYGRYLTLRQYSGKSPSPLFTEYPVLQKAIERCRERILAVELRRGDLPTAASEAALALRSIPGMQNLFSLLAALGKSDFDRKIFWFDQNRMHVLSHLVRACYPLETDTLEGFVARAASAGIPEKRLVELAIYAPQWSRYVEHTLQWAGLSDGIWWVYAHTKDRQWHVDQEIRAIWTAEIGEYTPLSMDALLDGAVDVAWFHRVIAILGVARWQAVYKAAIYAASGTGHARARLFADAMLGKLDANELSERVRSRRNQDALRALGLVPLPVGEGSQAEILRRYKLIQEFLRTSRQFGSQRQASEKLAASIAMENLARTAGFPDPQRLEWAMELEAVEDLAEGPVGVEVDGVVVSLSINDLGEAELCAARGEKALKQIPSAVKKAPLIAALIERKKELERQARRMRLSLETAMMRGDEFDAGEIQALFRHPILRVLLEQLVFIAPQGMGYPVEGGKALEGLGHRISLEGIDAQSPAIKLRIAHPYDLLQTACWHEWQRECFISERIQPFKQVFRELYVLTATELDEQNYSRRYAGHQVNPRQALALFGGRGWVVAPEEGVYKTFHSAGITARVGFLQVIYTPAEVEGLTIELVGFTRPGEWQPLKLDQVPARLFSEVMRDLDLVVSVAHAGGVDPEASASTVESRAALVLETCALLKLSNVRVENHHALVHGKRGNYTIHLGSAVVHKQPGGALCIIPVHDQQRGRLFLPFVDNDPKSAEVVSKVILLAKDDQIKDPTILEQIL
jgi:hypothetical protein